MFSYWRWLVMAAVLVVPSVSFGQLKVITSGVYSAPLGALLPEFTKATGIEVSTVTGQSQGNVPAVIGAQLRSGLTVDMVILSREGLGELVAEDRIVQGTETDLAKTPLGVAVRAGAPKPDISTVAAFKETLLRAKGITFPSSTTGIYMETKMFPQLGIAKEIAEKISHTAAAGVARGEAEITLQPVSELLHAPGVDFVGTIPAGIQYVSVFSAAVVKGTSKGDDANRLIQFLVSEQANAAVRKSGMEPVSQQARK